MNLYIVVEGRVGEKIVYQNWIPHINPSLTFVHKTDDIVNNNFYIVSGNGYPHYFEVILNAIEDVNNLNNIDRLLICIDAEEMTYEEKYNEITELIDGKSCIADIKIVIQYFCFETWALGNRKIGPRNNLDAKLQLYKNHYDVLRKDPENLPSYPLENLNRSQFAVKYLKKLLNRRGGNTYSKSNPHFIKYPKFCHEVRKRYIETSHIQSFQFFLDALV